MKRKEQNTLIVHLPRRNICSHSFICNVDHVSQMQSTGPLYRGICASLEGRNGRKTEKTSGTAIWLAEQSKLQSVGVEYSNCFNESGKLLWVLSITEVMFCEGKEWETWLYVHGFWCCGWSPWPSLLVSCICRPQNSAQNLGLNYLKKIKNVKHFSLNVKKIHFY